MFRNCVILVCICLNNMQNYAKLDWFDRPITLQHSHPRHFRRISIWTFKVHIPGIQDHKKWWTLTSAWSRLLLYCITKSVTITSEKSFFAIPRNFAICISRYFGNKLPLASIGHQWLTIWYMSYEFASHRCFVCENVLICRCPYNWEPYIKNFCVLLRKLSFWLSLFLVELLLR